jgi:acyl-CoA synthetase (AMP-forming)/AMP-acid ligase II
MPMALHNPTLTELLTGDGPGHLDTPIVFAGQGGDTSATLRQLRERAARFAGGLRRLGVGPRDRIAVQFPNSPEAVVVQLAALILDAVLVPVVPVFGARELAQIFADARPAVFVTASSWRNHDYVANLEQLPAGLRPPAVVIAGPTRPPTAIDWAQVEAAEPIEQFAPADEDAPALLIYTSGSTGLPKGVQHSRRTILAEALDLDYRGGLAEHRYLHTSGAGHIGGYVYSIRILEHGLRVVSVDGWDVDVAARVIETYRPTSTAVLPMHVAALVELGESSGLDLSCLRYCMVGGAPVPETLLRRAAALGVGVVNVYGLTELPTAAIGSLDDPLPVRAKYLGRATPGNRIRIADDQDRPLPDGTRGELQVKGPELFLGYTNVPDAEVFTADGWFRTGDIGLIEGDGLIRIVDRKKNLILRGGENLSATEIESIVNECPGVVECAVIGVPDQRYGERVAAFVVLEPGIELTLADLMTHFLAVGAAKQKVPEYLERLERLPRTGTGKLRKHDLSQHDLSQPDLRRTR